MRGSAFYLAPLMKRSGYDYSHSRFGFEIMGTVKYYAQIHLQVWQNFVCIGQVNLPLIAQ